MTTEMWLFAQFILQTLDGFTTGLMMELSLEKRDVPLPSRLSRILCYYALVFLICLPSWLMHYKVLPTINLLFTIAGTIFLTMKLYGASFRQSVTLFGFYLLIGCFAELALAYFYPLAFEMQVDWTKDVMFEPLFTTMLLVSVLKIVFALLYRMMGQDRAERSIFPILYGINLVLFVLLLIPLYMFFTSQSHASPQEVTRNLVIYFGFFTSILLFSAVVFRTQHIQDAKSLTTPGYMPNCRTSTTPCLNRIPMPRPDCFTITKMSLPPAGDCCTRIRMPKPGRFCRNSAAGCRKPLCQIPVPPVFWRFPA